MSTTKYKTLLFILISLSSGLLLAENLSFASDSETSGLGIASIFKMFAVLAFIIILIIAISKFANNKVLKLGGDELRIISSIPVGQKERLVLVKAMDETILVGVSQGYIRHISNIHTNKEFDLPVNNTKDTNEIT